MFHKRIISISFTILLLFSACSKSENRMTIVVFYDISGSMPSSSLRSNYLKITDEKILPKFCSGDRILGTTISDAPFREGNFDLNEEIKPFRFLRDGNEIKYGEKLKKQKEDIKNKVSGWLDIPPTKKTCVIDAVKMSERAFSNFPNPRKSLVIFSDMLEDCNGIDFEKKIPTDAEIEEEIKKIEQGQRLPNLKDVDVYIIGASGGLQGDDNSNRYYSLNLFWKRLLEKSGAKVFYEPINFRSEISECSFEYTLY